MRIAVGIDAHAKVCVARAVYAGRGDPNQKQTRILEDFNAAFGRMKTSREGLEPMARHLAGHDAHILIENSSVAHNVYWILKNSGCDVTVARSTDLYRITKSVKKNDENDAMELAMYMRRRMDGEREFAVCHMAPPEWMARRAYLRAIFADKSDLGDTKRRIHARLKVMGAELPRDYDDIVCPSSLKQLRSTRDPFLCYQVSVATDALRRIREAERLIPAMYSDDRNYALLITVPGIGPVMAAYLSSMIVDIGRFETKEDLASYFGMVPKQRSSADSDPACGITRRGDGYAREYLGYAAMAHIQWAEGSVVAEMYHRLKARGMPHKKVLAACARKLTEVVWSVLVNGKPFTSDQTVLRMARGTAEEIAKEAEEKE